jgi:protein involved in polysaccharide export with SLBB domain
MRGARLSLAVAALAVSACAPQQDYYAVDPATGQPAPVVTQQQLAQAQYAQQTYAQPQAASINSRALYSSSPAYAQQSYAQPTYQQPNYPQPVAQPQAASSGGRGLFTSPSPVFAQPQQTYYMQQPYVAQNAAPQGGPYVAVPNSYASASPYEQTYTLDSGDKLRIVVFGQEGISNSYLVDAGGNVNLPLIGAVPARGYGTQQLSKAITERLKQGYVREPHVSVEVEAYRPFFILGEVTTPGQYPYVANMTVETAVAIAGGFAPRANKNTVELTRNAPGQQFRGEVPLSFSLRPGDTIMVKERWF